MNRSRVPVGIAVFAWDTAWKVVAIRRAIKCHQYRWIAPLILVNSVGLLPILYLAKAAKPQAGGRAPDERPA